MDRTERERPERNQRTYPEYFNKFPEQADTSTVLGTMKSKMKKAISDHEEGYTVRCMDCLDELHTMIEEFFRLYKQKGAI